MVLPQKAAARLAGKACLAGPSARLAALRPQTRRGFLGAAPFYCGFVLLKTILKTQDAAPTTGAAFFINDIRSHRERMIYPLKGMIFAAQMIYWRIKERISLFYGMQKRIKNVESSIGQ